MQDADVWIGNPAIPRMLEVAKETDAAIVVVPVMLRRKSFELNILPREPVQGVEHYEAEEAGAGCMLINLAEIDRIGQAYLGPWFKREYKDERQTSLKTTGDHYFCRTVREHGGRLVVENTLRSAHNWTTVLDAKPDAPE
jgi:hypothetical protein